MRQNRYASRDARALTTLTEQTVEAERAQTLVAIGAVEAESAVLTRHGRALVDVMLTRLSRETGSTLAKRTDVTGSAGL